MVTVETQVAVAVSPNNRGCNNRAAAAETAGAARVGQQGQQHHQGSSREQQGQQQQQGTGAAEATASSARFQYQLRDLVVGSAYHGFADDPAGVQITTDAQCCDALKAHSKSMPLGSPWSSPTGETMSPAHENMQSDSSLGRA